MKLCILKTIPIFWCFKISSQFKISYCKDLLVLASTKPSFAPKKVAREEDVGQCSVGKHCLNESKEMQLHVLLISFQITIHHHENHSLL